MLDKWVVTVRGEMPRACPIALLDLRRAMRRIISTSRPVSPSVPGPHRWPHLELVELYARQAELFLGAQREEHVVHAAKLPEISLAVVQVGEAARIAAGGCGLRREPRASLPHRHGDGRVRSVLHHLRVTRQPNGLSRVS
jgi:hypothetical protein